MKRTLPANKKQCEEILLEQVRSAEQAYRLAAEHHRKLVEASEDRGQLDGVGDSALEQAVTARNSALREYTKLLKTFTELVVERRLPGC